MYQAHEHRKRSYQGGDPGRGGYRGGGGRGGGGGGGEGRFDNTPQPTEMQVTTNQYKFKTQPIANNPALMNNNTDRSDYTQYQGEL